MAVQTWRDDLKIAYSDDPDPDYAGHGMVCFPLVKHSVSPDQDMLSWWMSPAEQSAILFLLEHLRPKLSIEIGTQFGGSLQAIAWPAALCAALTGRTHGCTDRPANVKKSLANSEPSTHGT
jgi:hypothetical protein